MSRSKRRGPTAGAAPVSASAPPRSRRHLKKSLILGLAGSVVAVAAAWFLREARPANPPVRTPGKTPVNAPVPGNQAAASPEEAPPEEAPPARPVRPRVFTGEAGPWGKLEYTRISIEPPWDTLPPADTYGEPLWFFEHLTRVQVMGAFEQVGLTPAEREAIEQRGTWDEAEDGVVVSPPREVIIGLSPQVRASLYAVLSRYHGNVLQRFPTPVQPEFLEDPQQTRGFAPSTLALLKKLIYSRSTWMVFSDIQTLLLETADPSERKRQIALTLRNRTYVVSLRIEEGSDIEALERYWGYPGRSKRLEPLLRSLTRVAGGSSLDIVHLLPPMARRRIYTFPPPPEEGGPPARDCYWTALNFFRDPTDETFRSPERAIAALRADYQMVQPPYRFGDIVVLSSRREGQPIHAAVYVADDLLFTKNGRSPRQPWMFSKMDNMVSYYASTQSPGDHLETTVYRTRIPPEILDP